MTLLIIMTGCIMFAASHLVIAQNAFKNNLNTGVVPFGDKCFVRKTAGCDNRHPSFTSISEMSHPEETNNAATNESNSSVTHDSRQESSKQFPTINFKPEFDYDVQKDCDGLVLDCFYEWVGSIQSGKPFFDTDTRLIERLRKVKTRFIETI